MITVLRLLGPVLAAMLGLWLSPHSRVLIEWLRKPQNFVTRLGWLVVELTLVLRVSTLSRLCMTLRLLRPAESLIVRPPGGPVRLSGGGSGRSVGHGGEVAVSRGESRTRPSTPAG